MAYKLPNLFKDIPKNDIEQQIKWLEKQTEKVINRLPSLKENLVVYDDRSNDLYNKDVANIQLLTKIYTSQIKAGKIGNADINQPFQKYVSQLEQYGNKELSTLVWESTEKRIESFKEHIADMSGEESDDLAYAEELLSKLTPAQLNGFTRSKFFFDKGGPSCTTLVEFQNEYGVSVATAKLETYCEKNGIATDRKYFIEGETRKVAGGRPKKRKK